MSISGKTLREVEFRDRLRGYDTDEVDEFLENVALEIDATEAEMSRLRTIAEEAESRIRQAEAAAKEAIEAAKVSQDSGEDEGIRRTLVLARKTADLALREAREEAAAMVAEAKAEAERVKAEVDAQVQARRDQAEKSLVEAVARLTEQQDDLVAEISVLGQVLEAERTRLTEALTGALQFVSRAFPMSDNIKQIDQRVAEAQKSSGSKKPTPANTDGSSKKEVDSGPETPDGASASSILDGLLKGLGAESDDALWARFAAEAATQDESAPAVDDEVATGGVVSIDRHRKNTSAS